jgi:hypothetical protein
MTGDEDSALPLRRGSGAYSPDVTAFAHREAPFLLNIAARWSEPDESDLHIDWAGELDGAMAGFAAEAFT